MKFRSSFLCEAVSRGCDDGGMTSTTRIQRKYDHRLRELVRSTGDAEYAIQRGVPRSTARGWLTSTRAEVVTVDVVDMDTLRLQQEVVRLRQPAAQIGGQRQNSGIQFQYFQIIAVRERLL